MECMLHRPDSVRRLLVHSSAAGREGVEKLTALAGKQGVRVEEADRALARISGKENCYAAAVFGKFEDNLAAGKPHVVLHRPGDSGNVGTIMRTALGAKLVSRKSSDVPTPQPLTPARWRNPVRSWSD